MRTLTITFSLLLYYGTGLTQATHDHSSGLEETHCSVVLCRSNVLPSSIKNQGIVAQGRNFFTSILDTGSWPARWQCGTWSAFHGWLYILSDIVIWFSYFMIPIILVFFVYKKNKVPIPFRKIILLFIAFILACGLTHLIDAAAFWWPAYKLSALIRFTTAAISLVTVFALFRITPRVMEFKSPQVLEDSVKERTAGLNDLNARLREEINNRHRAEQKLKDLNKELEEKSDRLERINEELILREIELKNSEAEVLALNADLEMKVYDRTKELNAINQELEAFTYSVSHDLRAPLRSIHGYTNILSEDYYERFDNNGRQNIDVIIRNAQYMGQLIDDMLNFSRTSRTKLVKANFNTDQQVRIIVNELMSQEKNRNIIIEIPKLEDCQADTSLLKQVWINLLSNAIKYTRKNPDAKIEIKSMRHENEIEYVVKDNGVGFDIAYVDKLFGVFQRLHKREEFEGTGVGLALAKRIVERHGGRIRAEGKLNEGALFVFSLPLS